MPEAEVIQSGALTDTDRLKQLERLMAKGTAGGQALISEEQTTADPLVQEKAGDPALAERVAMSMVKQVGDEDTTLLQAIQKAGGNHAIYGQLVQDPAFLDFIFSVIKSHQVLPHLPEMVSAAVARGKAGDYKAMKTLLEVLPLDKMESVEEHNKRLIHATDEQLGDEIAYLEGRIRRLKDQLDSRFSTPQVEEAREQVIQDALQIIKPGRGKRLT